MNEPDVRIELITPEKAEKYLGRNTHNRPLRPRVVAAFVRDMRTGNWGWNGETVKLGDDEILLDGQHRMAAVVESGKSIRMLVVRGLPSSSQETVDTGTKRTFSDQLRLRGESSYTTLASVVRVITAWEAGAFRMGGGFAATSAELFATLEKYPWLREGLTAIDRVRSAAGLPSHVGGLCWWLFTQLDSEDADHFFDRLASDQDHHDGEPIYALRRALLLRDDSRSRDGHSRGSSRDRVYLTALTIKAWNRYRAGEYVAQLKFRAGGAKPEPFPEAR